jgi:hypothetical protein
VWPQKKVTKEEAFELPDGGRAADEIAAVTRPPGGLKQANLPE